MISFLKRKLKDLTRLFVLSGTDLIHVYSPLTGKDHYVLMSDLRTPGGYPDWVAKEEGYAAGDKVTYGLKLWESLVNGNTALPSEGANWTEVSETAGGAEWGSIDGNINTQGDLGQYIGALIGDTFMGFSWKGSARAATTEALPANTMSVDFQMLTANANGVLPDIDGLSPIDDWQLAYFGFLIKDEADKKKNGLYTIEDVGSAGTPWILRRIATSAISYVNAVVLIAAGDKNADTTWRQITDQITLGTTDLVFVNFHRFDGVIDGNKTIATGEGEGHAQLHFNKADDAIEMRWWDEIDYDDPHKGARMGVDAGGIFMAQNNYQFPAKGSVPFFRDDDGHFGFMELYPGEAYTVDSDGNPVPLDLNDLDPWFKGGDYNFGEDGDVNINGDFSQGFNINGAASFSFSHLAGSLSLAANTLIQAVNIAASVDEDFDVNTSYGRFNALSQSEGYDGQYPQLQIGRIDGGNYGAKIDTGYDHVPGSLLMIGNDDGYEGFMKPLNPGWPGAFLLIGGDGMPAYSNDAGFLFSPTERGIYKDFKSILLDSDSITIATGASGAILRLKITDDGVVSLNLTKLKVTGLPTSTVGLTTGDVWNNAGVLSIVL